MNAEILKNKISEIFQNLFPTATDYELNLLPESLQAGKMYEAYVLAILAQKLVEEEGVVLRLVNGNYIPLKSGCGGINRNYPRIEVFRRERLIGEIWTDIEFLTLSFENSHLNAPNKGHYHELDIVLVEPGITGRPKHSQLFLGVECKNLAYDKGLLKEILGVRRELSLLQNNQATKFTRWPRTEVPADPPSCLLVYSSSPKVTEYSDPGKVFGIDFLHEPLPS